jgi:hypothetical protein
MPGESGSGKWKVENGLKCPAHGSVVGAAYAREVGSGAGRAMQTDTAYTRAGARGDITPPPTDPDPLPHPLPPPRLPLDPPPTIPKPQTPDPPLPPIEE